MQLADLAPELRRLATRQHGVFTTAQAAGSYTSEQLRALVRRGAWRRVFRGAYVPAGIPLDVTTRLAAATLVLGADTIGCLHTAAALDGFGIVDDGRTHVARPGLPADSRPDLAVHQISFRPDEVIRTDGLLVSHPARTAADLARTLPRLDGIAVLDAAIGCGATDSTSVAEVLARQNGLRGVLKARALLALADGGAESPMESRLRLRVIDAGLPQPVTQYPVYDGSGLWPRFRLDLAWPDLRAAAEYDGAIHDGRQAIRADRARHNRLRALGWQVCVFTDADVYRYPGRIAAALAPLLS